MTLVIVSETSWPYAPMFCTGAAPTSPGIPDRASMPHKLRSQQSFTKSSQTTPAPAVTSPAESWVILSAAILTTSPENPPSDTSKLLPQPRTKTFRLFFFAKLRASKISCEDAQRAKYRAGPPVRSVV